MREVVERWTMGWWRSTARGVSFSAKTSERRIRALDGFFSAGVKDLELGYRATREKTASKILVGWEETGYFGLGHCMTQS